MPTDRELPKRTCFSDFPKVPFTVALGVSLSLSREIFGGGPASVLCIRHGVKETCPHGDFLIRTQASMCSYYAYEESHRRASGAEGAQRRERSGWASQRRQQE